MSSKSKKAGNLVALGSAAVVAVYGAGFMRTAAAAERFAEQSDQRVLSPEDAAAVQAESKPQLTGVIANDSNTAAPAARIDVPATTAAARVNKADATSAKADSKVQPTSVATSSREVSVPIPPEVTSAASGAAATATSGTPPVTSNAPTSRANVADAKSASEKTTAAPSTATSAPPVTQAVTQPITPAVTVAAAPAPTPATVAAPVTPPTAAPATATTTAEAGTPKLKDGEYTGYGTSRHGDVEVYLETTDGKITYVKISQCLTQYSCSWISDLPRQVLARQSPRVDGVSGATQSANAFYYAVVQALAKAK